MMAWDRVRRAIAEIAAGRPVVVVDDEDRENEGDLIFAAEHATSKLVSFVVRHTSGYVCVALPGPDCDRLALPAMCPGSADGFGTAFTVTVDAASGITTGISATDRARTIGALAAPGAVPTHFTRPGHVLPLRANESGVLGRPGHTEAAVDLARLAGLTPAGGLCEIVSQDNPTTMARRPELERFALEHGLQLVSIADLIAYRLRFESRVIRAAEAHVPTRHGPFRAVGYESVMDRTQPVAMVLGDVTGTEDTLVRVHSECLVGDVLGSLRCACSLELDSAMAAIAEEGRGVLVYLREQESSGSGLLDELRAYQAEDLGSGAAPPRTAGARARERHLDTAAQILHDLRVHSARLLTSDPADRVALEGRGVSITATVPPPHLGNLRHLRPAGQAGRVQQPVPTRSLSGT